MGDTRNARGFIYRIIELISVKNKFPEKTAIIMAIALCKGSPKEKARELFEYYDANVDRRLSEQEMKIMFTDYVETLSIILTYLGVGDESAELLS